MWQYHPVSHHANVGERRKLKVPHTQGYRDIGNPALGIPGGANLVFEVEAASIEDGPQIIHLDADNMPVYSEPDTAFLEL
ncbi:g11463 [Coccomyxa viridis]|uniref:peptidylprolyl isomerase n=1 Tax=Coccomyxa viridis TaxID=1274662 RepID=A0ABP1G853_9CHLO